jgi:predicted AlkP superfamily phosphohydrolase/phosphomutase
MGCKKILFVELDGATWDVINPLMSKGKLPNIKRLRDNGSSGVLMSEHAAISPKIWTSMFAGKGHEKTGIDFFGGTSRMVKCKRLWDIFSQNGYRVGIFGSFATWPPYKVNGFMIPAIDSVGTETYPPEYTVFQELALNERKKSKGIEVGSLPLTSTLRYAIKLKKIGVRWKTYLKVLRFFIERGMRYLGRQKDRHWKKVLLHSDISTDVFIHLSRRFRPDFATIHMHICDFLSHRYWMAYEPGQFPGVDRKVVEEYGDVIPRGYIQADKAIGRIIDSVGKEANVVLVSDHGFEAKAGGFNPHEISADNLLEVLRIRGKVIAARFGPGVYLNFQDETLMCHVADVLAHAFSEKTGEKVFHVRVFEKTLIVQKPMEELNRDEILKRDSFIDFGQYGRHRALDLYAREKQMMSGVHAEEGVIIMCGPDLKMGVQLEDISFYDVAPTVLCLMGFAVARDMCGRVITEAINERFLKENPVRAIETYEEDVSVEDVAEEMDYGKIEERLRSLGYL